ncbi:MAG: type II secretion system F family protein [Pseudomonadales bacterium]|nr:type II secretion system F family protein [Pseudomonadales bacterium]MBO6564950.1 type II secretion system F family protein [Pseudomonadales bacterium]MBO6597091.1 type II secretion system F family protein [Pseudomonadales bacterium]MBO6823722.1 type II secretion system F family protein [Pseudomonadales bacterium]
MAEFRYRAIDSYGKFHTGVIQARGDDDVEFRLEKQGLDLISCKPHKRRNFRFRAAGIDARDLINMVFHLEQLTSSGVPLIDGLADLRDSVGDPYFKDVLSGVVESIQGGNNFSTALAEYPNDFDEVFVALMAVGEEAGELPKVLKEVGETMRQADELLAQAKRVMTYPAIVGGIILLVSAFLMMYLVPRIVPFVAELGGELPFHTIALIAVSDFVASYWWLILTLPLLAYSVLNMLARSSTDFRYAYDGMKLRIPLFGALSLKIRLARFATYLALLYGAGVTVIRSLEICEELIDNAYLRKAMAEARQSITEGIGFSDGFAKTQIFPPLIIRMIEVGETTGNLDEAMRNVSYFYDREVKETIEAIEPAISPALTVVMGGLLGWIMLSVLGPVWEAATGIG